METSRRKREWDCIDDMEPECLNCRLSDCRFTGSYARNCPYLQSMRRGTKPPEERVTVARSEARPNYSRSMCWALRYEDFSDLTVAQIAEVFDKSVSSVYSAITWIKTRYGYDVPHIEVYQTKK